MKINRLKYILKGQLIIIIWFLTPDSFRHGYNYDGFRLPIDDIITIDIAQNQRQFRVRPTGKRAVISSHQNNLDNDKQRLKISFVIYCRSRSRQSTFYFWCRAIFTINTTCDRRLSRFIRIEK